MRLAFVLLLGLSASLAAQAPNDPDSGSESSNAQPAASGWSPQDTRNANQYIRLLDEDPSAENVLDLLWRLYERHDAAALLVETYARDAEQSHRVSSRIVLGHFLRRQGHLAAARDAYRSVLTSHPDNPHALTALVSVCRELEEFPEAIAALERRIEALDPGHPFLAQVRLELGRLHHESGHPNQAAAQWELALREQPGDEALRKSVSHACLAAGLPEDAARHLEPLSRSSDPEKALAALSELAQLYEFAGLFERARDSLRTALERTHFQHRRHLDLFQDLVRLHERFDQLPGLEEALLAAASAASPSEADLARLVRFYALTAQPEGQLPALRRLAQTYPSNAVYQEDLIRVLLDLDQAGEAAEHLDRLTKDAPEPPLRLILLQCETDLRRADPAQAEERLARFLAESEASPEETAAALAFALDRHLDRVAEDLLRLFSLPDSDEHAAALAEFLLQRNRRSEAAETLDAFAQRAPDPQESARRRSFSAELLRSAGALAEAAQSAESALSSEAGRSQHLRLAEVYLQQHSAGLALETLEKAWLLSTSPEDRIDVDERILAVLQGENTPEKIEDPYDESPPSSVAETLEDILRNPSTGGTPNAAAPLPLHDHILEFYQKLSARTRDSQNPEERLRLAWWAFRTGNFADAYPLLLALERDLPEDPAVCRLLFDLSRAAGDFNRAAAQLDRLARLEPGRRSEHLRQLAELELSWANPARALEILEPLQSEIDPDPAVLETLARVRLALQEPEEARILLERALELSRGGDRRRLLDSLAAVFTTLENPQGMLSLSMKVLLEEPDPSQRQNLFEIQLAHARRFGLLQEFLALLRRESRRQPFDSFLLNALASVQATLGEHEDAFLSLRRAWFMDSGPPRILPALRDAALKAGRPADAVYYQRQLVASPAYGDKYEHWETLVQLLEDSFAAAEAQEVRERLERRFAQDATILSRLAASYRNEKRSARALATQRQLNRLRPWDPGGAFSEAELLEACGKPREAVETYLRVLTLTEQSGDITSKPETPELPLPVLPWLMSGYEETDPFSLRLLEQNGLLSPAIVEQISRSLSQTRVLLQPPETLDPPLRLWSIQRAATLLHDLGDPSLAGWISRWRDLSPTRPTEALWAFFYAGAQDDAWELLQSRSSADPGQQFLRFALGLAMQRETELAQEIAREDNPPGASSLLLAARAWLWSIDTSTDAGREYDRLQSALPVRRRSIQHLAAFLDASRGPGDALAVGRKLEPRLRGTFDGPSWARQLAAWAGAGNDPASQRRYLDLALNLLARSPTPATEPLWESLLRERLPLAVTAGEFEAIASLAARRLRPFQSEADPFRIAAITTQWGGQPAARRALRAFAGTALATPLETFEQLSADGELRFWDSLSLATRQLADKGLWPEARFLLAEIQEISPLAVPPGNEARAASHSLLHLALLWDFEFLPHPDRLSRLRSHLALHRSHDQRVSIAQELEAHGYAREAIPVYASLADDDPANSARFLGLLRACREALVPEPAILRLTSALAVADPERPSRDTLQYHENLARFLALARRDSELRERSALTIQAYIDRRSENPYLRELADLLVAEQRWEEALPVVEDILAIRTGRTNPAEPLQLSSLTTTRTDDRRFALLLAAIHENLGSWSRAAAVYSSLTSFQENGAPDPEIARRLASALLECKESLALLELGKTCLKRGPITALPHIADCLAQAGQSTAAASLLLMGARRASTDDNPAHLLLALLQLHLQQSQPPRLEADFEPLFEYAVENPGLRRGFLKLLLDHGAPHRHRLEPLLEANAASPSRRPLAILALAALLPPDSGPGPLLERWQSAVPLPPSGLDDHNLMAGILFETGHPNAARAFYESHLLPTYQHGGLAQPLYLRILLALDDEEAIRRLHRRLLDDRQPFNSLHAEMFRQEGLLDEAIALAQHQARRDALQPPPGREFELLRNYECLKQLAGLLLDAGRRSEAEGVLRRLFHRGPGDIDLLVQLYSDWPEAGSPGLRLKTYHLPPVLEQRTLEKIALAANPAGR
ncbi:MAG TPA: hypothetical protein VMN36_06320 [Verrucomicrobiales bacterium]|nr:hypothetical protein [Verrucomicrobiales bacterium]